MVIRCRTQLWQGGFEHWYVTCHEVHFRAVMERRMKLNSEDAVQVWKKHLKKAEQRIRELDQMFIRLYEDNVKGRISEDR